MQRRVDPGGTSSVGSSKRMTCLRDDPFPSIRSVSLPPSHRKRHSPPLPYPTLLHPTPPYPILPCSTRQNRRCLVMRNRSGNEKTPNVGAQHAARSPLLAECWECSEWPCRRYPISAGAQTRYAQGRACSRSGIWNGGAGLCGHSPPTQPGMLPSVRGGWVGGELTWSARRTRRRSQPRSRCVPPRSPALACVPQHAVSDPRRPDASAAQFLRKRSQDGGFDFTLPHDTCSVLGGKEGGVG